MPGGIPVERSTQKQRLNGREYYVHIVQRGQTVYSISRAYGVKDYDAVVKKDIHFLSVGDTVWLPVQKVSELTTSAPHTSTPTAQQASHVAGSAAASEQQPIPKAVIRDRRDREMVVVSLMMPLYLDQIDAVSTTKFDVEQRGRKSYSQFDFIQFYEGLQMGLNELQRQGFSVRLNVVDKTVCLV